MIIKTLSVFAMSAFVAGCVTLDDRIDQIGEESLRSVQLMAESSPRMDEPEAEERYIDAAKEAAVRDLVDPESAQFRDIEVVAYNNGYVVCGEINGKNRMGGYVGFRPFVAGLSDARLAFIPSPRTRTSSARVESVELAANRGLIAACGN